jgi:hypothetical protein
MWMDDWTFAITTVPRYTLKDMQIRQSKWIQLFGTVRKSLDGIRVIHIGVWIDRTDSNARAICSNGVHDCLDYKERKSPPIRNGTAVLICSLICTCANEFVQQVAIRSMDLERREIATKN